MCQLAERRYNEKVYLWAHPLLTFILGHIINFVNNEEGLIDQVRRAWI